jgi:hypothetical protein
MALRQLPSNFASIAPKLEFLSLENNEFYEHNWDFVPIYRHLLFRAIDCPELTISLVYAN